METYLLDPIEVALDALFLDPNNPRISPLDPPGYEDLSALFDTSSQPAIEKTVLEKFDIAALVEGIIEQGWVPLDAILVWEPPKGKGKCVVLEGNRRTVALRQIVHQELPAAEKKWNTIQAKKSKYDEATTDAAKDRLDRIREIVKETRKLRVFPISAANTDELDRKLARVLGVRHISGARKWTNYAEDLYLLKRYTKVFKAKYPKEKIRLDPVLITKVGEESSLLPVEARRKIQAASAHRHFRLEYEDKLPPGESFGETDHYLFEQIVRKPFLRDQFQLGKDDLQIAPEGETALFAWTFAKPRPKNADKNENILYRHENVSVWDQMKRYDDANKTSFASRFEVADPQSAEPFRIVEAEWISHKAKQSPVDVVSKLVKQFEAMEVKTMLDSSAFIEPLLQRLGKLSAKYLKMLAAAQ